MFLDITQSRYQQLENLPMSEIEIHYLENNPVSMWCNFIIFQLSLTAFNSIKSQWANTRPLIAFDRSTASSFSTSLFKSSTCRIIFWTPSTFNFDRRMCKNSSYKWIVRMRMRIIFISFIEWNKKKLTNRKGGHQIEGRRWWRWFFYDRRSITNHTGSTTWITKFIAAITEGSGMAGAVRETIQYRVLHRRVRLVGQMVSYGMR